jgi:hypothetical protein
MRSLKLCLLLAVAIFSTSAQIEQRHDASAGSTAASWPTLDRMRVRREITQPAGAPVAVDLTLPDGFNPDSVRVIADGGTQVIPAKTEWRRPSARISFFSTGAAAYWFYFDEGRQGETQRLAAPAMVGTGDRITYGRAGVRNRVAVGLQPRPAVLDADGDGDLDLVISCPDRPYNGIYLFTNIGSNADPLFDRAEWLGPSSKELTAADFNGDGNMDLVTDTGYFSDFRHNRLSHFVKITVKRSYFIGRDNMWQPFDWDGDGRIDLLAGVSDWRDYGWDDAFDSTGKWTRGPLHGYVYLHRNTGTNENPVYEAPVMLRAGGKPIDLYGSPAPTPVDWLGRGVFDLLGGSFVDSMTLFRNTGTRTAPNLAAGDPVQAAGQPLHMDLCMIQPRVAAFHPDGRPSLVVAQEDGTVSLIDNTAPRGQEPVFTAPRYLEQLDPYVKSGVLSRPAAVDWNGDGKLDLLSGDSAGYIEFFENTGTTAAPVFTDRGYLTAGGKVIRRIAGPNGSIQGPAERKWGYSNPSVADWDGDGLMDILVNDIWGSVVWYRNTGTKTAPSLAPAAPIEVEWSGAPPKPEWVWWEPKGKELVTQWRTTPKVVDWDRDGLPDLVMLNHQGYLSLFRRARRDGKLVLLPPERIFVTPAGRFLNLSAGRAGASGRRKVEIADMDGDGDLDLIVDADGGPAWYENIGTEAKPVMELRGALVKANIAGHSPAPNVVDWNGDGKLDLIVGAEDGFFYYFDGRYIESLRKTPTKPL